mmetsp:Transcript_4214/g.6839  ORF Transcript_4214/g.6839 Transcript_4214/m.6839 type:complete len:297 (+) Transcript_4214:710-1600(+)
MTEEESEEHGKSITSRAKEHEHSKNYIQVDITIAPQVHGQEILHRKLGVTLLHLVVRKHNSSGDIIRKSDCPNTFANERKQKARWIAIEPQHLAKCLLYWIRLENFFKAPEAFDKTVVSGMHAHGNHLLVGQVYGYDEVCYQIRYTSNHVDDVVSNFSIILEHKVSFLRNYVSKEVHCLITTHNQQREKIPCEKGWLFSMCVGERSRIERIWKVEDDNPSDQRSKYYPTPSSQLVRPVFSACSISKAGKTGRARFTILYFELQFRTFEVDSFFTLHVVVSRITSGFSLEHDERTIR